MPRSLSVWRQFNLGYSAIRLAVLWQAEWGQSVDCVKFYSRSDDAVIRIHDGAGNLIETHENKGDFRQF